MQSQKYYLSKDVCSYKGAILYGPAGAEVTIVSEHGDVLIVQAISGERFPINREELSQDVTPTKITAPAPIIDLSVPQKKTKKKSAPKTNQQDLF